MLYKTQESLFVRVLAWGGTKGSIKPLCMGLLWPWSITFRHESCSHHPNMKNACILPKHRCAVMRQVVVLADTVFLPSFSFSHVFLLFRNITNASSTALLTACEYCAVRDSEAKRLPISSILQILIGSFSAFSNSSRKNCIRDSSFEISTSQFLIWPNKSLCPSRPNSISLQYNKYKKMH